MGAKIYIEPTKIWEFFNDHRLELFEKELLIAEDKHTNTEILLTNEYGHPTLIVLKDNDLEYQEVLYGATNCNVTSKHIYEKYLTIIEPEIPTKESAITPHYNDEEHCADYTEYTDAEYEREDQLICAIYDFLETVLIGGKDEDTIEFSHDSDKLADILNSVLLLLSTEFDLQIKRPNLYCDEDEQVCYSEFPYEDDSYLYMF